MGALSTLTVSRYPKLICASSFLISVSKRHMGLPNFVKVKLEEFRYQNYWIKFKRKGSKLKSRRQWELDLGLKNMVMLSQTKS